MGPGASSWERQTGEKVEQQLWRLAQEILSLGMSVVLDFGLWARSERDEMRTVARHRSQTPRPEIHDRERSHQLRRRTSVPAQQQVGVLQHWIVGATASPSEQRFRRPTGAAPVDPQPLGLRQVRRRSRWPNRGPLPSS